MIWQRSLLLFVFVFLSACDLSLAGDVTPPPGVELPAQSESPETVANGPLYPLLPADPQAGKPIYQEKCAPCHGPEGKGDGSLADRLPKPVPAIGDDVLARQSRPSDWYQIVTQGRMENQMPPFESLSDQERWNVVAYVYTLSTSQDRLDEGKALYSTYCASCHGEDGIASQKTVVESGNPVEGEAARVPTQFTKLEWIANRSANDLFQVISTGLGETMPAFQDQLPEAERWKLTEYLRSISLNTARNSEPGQALAAAEDEPATIEESEGLSPGETTSSESVENADAQDARSLSAEKSKTGTVTGLVNNLSGGENPGGLEIMLHEFDGMQLVMTRTVELDENGLFTIADVPVIPEHSYLAITEFEGVTYGSDIAVFDEGQDVLDLPIDVYESTSDASQIVIDRLHLFLEPVDNNTLRVITLLILSNLGNKVVVPNGEIEPSIIFPLPEGAAQLEFQDGRLGERFIPVQDGFGDLAAVKPGSGSHQVLFAYELPFKKKLNLLQKMNLPVKAVVVLVPEDGIRIRGENLQDVGTRDVEGFLYRTYNGAGIDAQGLLDLSISNVNTLSFPGLSAGSDIGVLIGIIVLAGAVITTFALLNRKIRKTNGTQVVREVEALPQEPETVEGVMDCILALDDLYKAGQLPEEAYLKRRKELKDRLRQLA